MIKLRLYRKEGHTRVHLPLRNVIYVQVFVEPTQRECLDGISRDVFGEVVAPGGAFWVHSMEELTLALRELTSSENHQK